MDSRKIVFKETGIIAVGELVCSAVMVGIFAALDHFDLRVVLSALAGSLIMVINYFFMAVTASIGADKAKSGEVQQAQKMIQLSSVVRLFLMGVILFVGIKLGANVVALVLPLVFVRPILLLAELFRKKGD